MGGKQAKERRRLKRLGKEGITSPSRPTDSSSKVSIVDSEAMNESNNRDEMTSKPEMITDSDNSNHEQMTQHKMNFSNSSQSTNNMKTTRNKQKSTRHTNNTKTIIPHKKKQTMKKKKPKHLKRKLENAIKENDKKEKEKLERLMMQFQDEKKTRNELFEAHIKKLSGDSFDPDTFHTLIRKGASKVTILEAMGIKKKINNMESVAIAKVETTGENWNKNKNTNTNTNEEHANKKTKSMDTSSKIMSETKTEQDIGPTMPQPTDGTDKNENTDKTNNPEVTKMISSVSPSISHQNQNPEKDSNSDNSLSSDDDSDTSENLEILNKRTRGKKRKNQKEADEKRRKDQNESKFQQIEDEKKKEEEHKKNKKQRRCIGRKPVTDFELGKHYKGKVVYVKPFGAFIDIMCHSDAFCHVSRVQDDYVENIDSILKEGQEVYPRVVEINRKKRRITVSLQSDEKKDDEMRSMNNRLERQEIRKQQKKAKKKTKLNKINQNADNSYEAISNSKQSTGLSSNDVKSSNDNLQPGDNNLIILQNMDQSQMSRAEMKQLRKLQRRADRRKENTVNDDGGLNKNLNNA